MITLIIYGLVIGLIAKALHRGDEPVGCISTIVIGIAGSILGGYLSFILRLTESYHMAGPIMSVIGGVICCSLWSYYNKK